MAKARPHERVFALTLALVFLGTTIATGLAVVWTMRQDNNATEVSNTQEDPVMQDRKLADFEPTEAITELTKIDLIAGEGEEVKPGASVTVHYTGALAKDGTIFESSKDSGQPASFPLEGVIEGWTNGVPGMKVGGTRRLLIPAAQAYGPQGSASIPPNSDLVFDIELISID